MFANTQMMGIDTGLPDVCLTPTPAPVPIPYPNIARARWASRRPTRSSSPACAGAQHGTTVTPLTNGDNVGVAMGVASGMVMGPSRHLTARSPCSSAGMPATA
jgi:hypothetical protein